eukprot:COSAG05_NODE_9545_length_616_cov_3.547389_2_plen_62_part_01
MCELVNDDRQLPVREWILHQLLHPQGSANSAAVLQALGLVIIESEAGVTGLAHGGVVARALR